MQFQDIKGSLIKGAVFLLILIAIDQLILLVIKKAIYQPRWSETPIVQLEQAKDTEIILLGTCQVSNDFNSKIIQSHLGYRVFNAAKRGSGTGAIEFVYHMAKDFPKLQYVVLVLSDGLLEDTFKLAKDEFLQRELFAPFLSRDSTAFLEKKYHVLPIQTMSGLLSYDSAGDQLVRLLNRTLSKTPQEYQDGFAPRLSNWNLVSSIKSDPKPYQDAMMKEIKITPFAIAQIEEIIQSAQAKGQKVILVQSPMHYLRATDEVNEKQNAVLKNLGDKYHVQTLSYLDNHLPLSHEDKYWSDVGHMNALGADYFSSNFADDLAKLITQKPGIAQ